MVPGLHCLAGRLSVEIRRQTDINHVHRGLSNQRGRVGVPLHLIEIELLPGVPQIDRDARTRLKPLRVNVCNSHDLNIWKLCVASRMHPAHAPQPCNPYLQHNHLLS